VTGTKLGVGCWIEGEETGNISEEQVNVDGLRMVGGGWSVGGVGTMWQGEQMMRG